MASCQYILLSGKNCKRKVIGEKGLCWQHSTKRATPKVTSIKVVKPKVTIPKVVKTEVVKTKVVKPKVTSTKVTKPKTGVEKKTAKPKMEMEECDDFLKCSKKSVINGYDVLIIPKGTILYHGTSILFPDNTLPKSPAYLADLQSAQRYAFRGEKFQGGDGKIISFKTIKPITLLNITKKSLDKLSKLEDFNFDNFEYAFNYGAEELVRHSHDLYDTQVTKWLCEQNLFDGWCQHLPKFHPEILVCSIDKIVRYDVEYRFDGYYFNNLFKLKNNKLIDILKRDAIGKIHFSTKYTMFGEQNEDRTILKQKNKSDKEFVKQVNLAVKKGLVKRPTEFEE
jgi:hypothetical protein